MRKIRLEAITTVEAEQKDAELLLCKVLTEHMRPTTVDVKILHIRQLSAPEPSYPGRPSPWGSCRLSYKAVVQYADEVEDDLPLGLDDLGDYMTDATINFFEAAISYATRLTKPTLGMALSMLQRAPAERVIEWCKSDTVQDEATVTEFADHIVKMVGYFGDKDLQELLDEHTEKLQQTARAARISVQVLQTALLLVDVEITLREVATWSEAWKQKAMDWAHAVHLHANDNDDVEVPECPYWVPPTETEKRLATQTKQEDRRVWKVFLWSDPQRPVGEMILPKWTPDIIRRFAYQHFKEKLAQVTNFDVR